MIFLLLGFAAGGHFPSQKMIWDGRTEQRDGVTIVENTGRPIHEGNILLLTEELSIGGEAGSGEQQFSDIYDFDVDPSGNIYILDMRAAEIRAFDKEGRFLRSFGKRGQGPGEFQIPVYMEISRDGQLLCFDATAFRMTYFSLTGEFVKQKVYPMVRGFRPTHVDSQGNLIGRAVLAPAPIGGEILKIVNAEGNLSLELCKVESDESKREKKEFDIGKPWICHVADRSDHIYWGYPERYEIRMVDAAGHLIKIIRNRTKAVAISPADKIAYEKDYADVLQRGFKLVFRDSFPLFESISVDAHNQLFVKKREQGTETSARYSYDIYDPDGRYLAKVLIPANLNEMSVWAGDKLYTRETDADGIEKIVRYRVSWNLK